MGMAKRLAGEMDDKTRPRHDDDTVIAVLREVIESDIHKSVKKTILTCLLIWVLQRPEARGRLAILPIRTPKMQRWRAGLPVLTLPIGYVIYHWHMWSVLSLIHH
jgi:hypothetical protein